MIQCVHYADPYDVKISVVRLRTIATLGRSMGNDPTYNFFPDFKKVVCDKLDIDEQYMEENKTQEIVNNMEGYVSQIQKRFC